MSPSCTVEQIRRGSVSPESPSSSSSSSLSSRSSVSPANDTGGGAAKLHRLKRFGCTRARGRDTSHSVQASRGSVSMPVWRAYQLVERAREQERRVVLVGVPPSNGVQLGARVVDTCSFIGKHPRSPRSFVVGMILDGAASTLKIQGVNRWVGCEVRARASERATA